MRQRVGRDTEFDLHQSIDGRRRVKNLSLFDTDHRIDQRSGCRKHRRCALGFTVNGVSSFNSALLNETQHEATQFGFLSLQKHVNDIDVQISAFTPAKRTVIFA